jgi:hypothetical protein
VGLFDLFGSREKRDAAALRKHAQRVTQKYGPAENRQASIAQLAKIGTAEALATLCLRFTVYSEPSITDAEEKETARAHLVDAGEKAVAPVREFLSRQEEGVSWGLRVLAALVPSAEATAFVLGLLRDLGRGYSRDPGKKLTLLGWLAEHHEGEAAPPSSAVEEALLPLLEDFSDDVRIAAVRVLPGMAPGEKTRDGLIALLLRDQDNARVRREVLQALADIGADVKGHRPSVEPLLVEPYFLDREGRVKKRG